MIGTHNLSYAHREPEIGALLDAYDAVLPILAEGIRSKDLEKRLRCKALEPLFKVR